MATRGQSLVNGLVRTLARSVDRHWPGRRGGRCTGHRQRRPPSYRPAQPTPADDAWRPAV